MKRFLSTLFNPYMLRHHLTASNKTSNDGNWETIKKDNESEKLDTAHDYAHTQAY